MENLRRDRYLKEISEDRWGDRKQRSYIVICRKRERRRGKEQQQRSEQRSLKTDGETESGEPTSGSLERERGEESSEQQVSEGRWGDRERRTYIGISSKRERGREEKSKSRDLSNRSLKTDGQTESGEPT